MRNRARKNYVIYVLMLLLFGGLIYVAIEEGDRFSHYAVNAQNMVQGNPFTMFLQFIQDNLHHPLTTLLIQIIAVLLMVRLFGYLFSLIGQPGVIGEIVAGIVLGPSVLGFFFPDAFHFLFPAHSLTNLELLSQVGLILFMFVIGMELDFSVLKNKINETLVISHAGILVPFFLGILSSYWVYEEYAAAQTPFLPFALFIGISMSITAFPVLARIIQERNMTKTPLGTLTIASAANDDVTAWCLLARLTCCSLCRLVSSIRCSSAFCFSMMKSFRSKCSLPVTAFDCPRSIRRMSDAKLCISVISSSLSFRLLPVSWFIQSKMIWA